MEMELELEMEPKSQSKSDDCHGDEQLLLLLLTVADCCLLLPVGQLLVLSNGHLNATTTKLITITRCIETTTRTLSTTTTTIAVTVKRLRPLLSSRQRTRIEPNRDSSCLPFYLLPPPLLPL